MACAVVMRAPRARWPSSRGIACQARRRVLEIWWDDRESNSNGRRSKVKRALAATLKRLRTQNAAFRRRGRALDSSFSSSSSTAARLCCLTASLLRCFVAAFPACEAAFFGSNKPTPLEPPKWLHTAPAHRPKI